MNRKMVDMDWLKNDYYSLLGVTQMATTEEIHKAYRKKAKLYHPDRYNLSPEERIIAEKKFKELQLAHDILTDPVKRDKYNEELLIIQQSYLSSIIYDIPVSPKKEESYKNIKKSGKPIKKFNENLKRAYEEVSSMKLRTREDGTYYYSNDIEEVEIYENPPKRIGISEFAKKNAAKVYYAYGMRYAAAGDYYRAISAFNNAIRLDPDIKVPNMWKYFSL